MMSEPLGTCSSVFSPGGAKDRSPRRKPWGETPHRPSPGGAKERGASAVGRYVPSPLRGWKPPPRLFPRLAPWATVFRPSGAKNRKRYTSTATVMLVSDPNVSTTFTHAVYFPFFAYTCPASLKTVSDAGHVYAKKGKYTACVKVVDTFGSDTSITVAVEV